MNNTTVLFEYNAIIKSRFGWVFDDPPTLQSFEFEKINPFYWHKFVEDNWKLSYYAGAAYIIVIFGLQKYMQNRQPVQLKVPFFLWNLGLGIFSILGFSRMLPDFLNSLSQPNGFYISICMKQGVNPPTMYWILLFALSKFWELGDTIFIVLRKKPLVFLQWYHHFITMTVVWTLAPLVEPISRWYAILNFGVHSMMYPYFASKVIGIRVPSQVAKIITTFQLLQMIIGLTVNMTSLYILQSGQVCARDPISIRTFNIVYGTFLLLFGNLFYESVIKGGRTKKKKSL